METLANGNGGGQERIFRAELESFSYDVWGRK